MNSLYQIGLIRLMKYQLDINILNQSIASLVIQASNFFFMELNKLISRPQCIDTYKEVSNYLGSRLDEVLESVEQFYYSDFWVNRFKRRLQEEGLEYNPIELDRLLGATTSIKDDNVFKLFDDVTSKKGISKRETIALNINMNREQSNDSHIENVIMHEFGHRQYNQSEFHIVEHLNNKILKSPSPMGLESELDYQYFTNKNEIRQRIIPLVKEMYDNNMIPEEMYYLSPNLRQDSLFNIYSKVEIIYWLNNIL